MKSTELYTILAYYYESAAAEQALLKLRLLKKVSVRRIDTQKKWTSFFSVRTSNTHIINPIISGQTLIALRSNNLDLLNISHVLTNFSPSAVFLLSPASISHKANAITPLAIKDHDKESNRPYPLTHLRERVKELGKVLTENYNVLNRTTEIDTIGSAGQEYANDHAGNKAIEWLLDNGHLLTARIQEMQDNLEESSAWLPITDVGAYRGLPRVYQLAQKLIADAGENTLTLSTITKSLTEYQLTTPLSSDELWTFPLILRVVYMERIAMLSEIIVANYFTGQWARFWAYNLLTVAQRTSGNIPELLSELAINNPRPSVNFAGEITRLLQQNEYVSKQVNAWLEHVIGDSLASEIQADYRAAYQHERTLDHSIGSIRLLSQIDWNDIFEDVSRTEFILRADPAEMYAHMDFTTRDAYRHKIQVISQKTKLNEWDIAKTVIELASEGNTFVERHIGYYLLDEGLTILEQKVSYEPTQKEKNDRFIKKHGAVLYIGSSICLSFLLTGALFVTGLLWLDWPLVSLIILSILALPPLSEVAHQLVTYSLTLLVGPTLLPKLSFKEGIPETFRTAVVVPTLLLTPESIRQELQRLEVRYLANRGDNLYFGLLSDYADAPDRTMPGDAELLDIAVQGIHELNKRYERGTFFLYHRNRVWSESEQRWMGWERKRGKLNQFNELVLGNDAHRSYLLVGSLSDLRGCRFSITLDADTQLPMDTARQLTATLAHPLNQPVINTHTATLVRGYTIIQPSLTTVLPNATLTLFSRIFTDSTGLNPYTQTVSDVYQDITGEASYIGKGIYDIRTFHTLTENAFPENHILSHDLLEGAYVKTGLASDITLLDLFPSEYASYIKRQHRWIRGDWQIIDWLFTTVPTHNGYVHNPLSLINKWKIFDNLRRSIIPVSVLLLILVSWLAVPKSEATLFVAAITTGLLLSPLITIFSQARNTQRFSTTRSTSILYPLLRIGITIALIPYEAYIVIDAIARVWYRRTISQRHLLQWETAQQVQFQKKFAEKHVLISLGIVSAIGIIGAALLTPLVTPPLLIWLYLLSWIISPLIIWTLSFTVRRKISFMTSRLMARDLTTLRHIARRTWRFFDTFVTEEHHWLPPDNYQSDLNIAVAPRTSPTNIGLALLGIISAQDFGYATIDQAIERLSKTVGTLREMERYQGHFLNWYTTTTLQPLGTRYVSTVDSGNLLGCLLALEQSLYQLKGKPVLDASTFHGLRDAVELATQNSPVPPEIKRIAEFLSTIPERVSDINAAIRQLHTLYSIEPTADYWLTQTRSGIDHALSMTTKYVSWVSLLNEVPAGMLPTIDFRAHIWRREALRQVPSIESLATGQVPGVSYFIDRYHNMPGLPTQTRNWLHEFSSAFSKAQENAAVTLQRIEQLAATVRKLAQEINMGFLYNSTRRLFPIGYNVDEQRSDSSFYDLLSSEARLASFIAVARKEVPLEHWWSLGRQFSTCYNMPIMLSWSGSLFEYLMPLLLTKSYENSLLDEYCRNAVECQIRHGKQLSLPWGISEAAYSAVDAQKTYQYRAFGVPGLGMRRGMEKDLVVAPYATMLALVVNPVQSVKNIYELIKRQAIGEYGFFDSIDYMRSPEVVVHTYLAHHQGMILLSIDNALHQGVMQNRFHANLEIRAAENLLYERIPAETLEDSKIMTAPPPRIRSRGHHNSGTAEIFGPVPSAHVQSNGSMALLATASGGGYTRWNALDITRWRADTTKDDYGNFCYIKDIATGEIWSNSYQPMRVANAKYEFTSLPSGARYTTAAHDILTITTVTLAPDANVELRRLTFKNLRTEPVTLEVTTYQELAMADHMADRAHPAFLKLSVETQYDPESQILSAHRRQRNATEQAVNVAATVLAQSAIRPLTYETDRMAFIGRGHTLGDPQSIRTKLSETTGPVIDPILSLRSVITIAPGETAECLWVTAVAATLNSARKTAATYTDPAIFTAAEIGATKHAEVQLRHLGITAATAAQFQQLAGYIMYPHSSLRAAPKSFNASYQQSSLWSMSISGDLPIIMVAVSNKYDLVLAREIILAHTFLRLQGCHIDLIALSEQDDGYRTSLYDDLVALARAHATHVGMEQPGGIYVKNKGSMSPDQYAALYAVARINLSGGRGSLSRYLAHISGKQSHPSKSLRAPTEAIPLPARATQLDNGMGGFDSNANEYVFDITPLATSPAPWSNVLANPTFGTLVMESGINYSWNNNSQSNRLTQWNNDPVAPSPSEVVYVRDTISGEYWSPTPLPGTSFGTYRVRHGLGYSIHKHEQQKLLHELTTFVPNNEHGGKPLRYQILKIKNQGTDRRSLSLYNYFELTMGTDREVTQPHVRTLWDPLNATMVARNPYRSDYQNAIVFAGSTHEVSHYTGNRARFIGRNGTLSEPEALQNGTMTTETGSGFDPCIALQTNITIDPGESIEVVFFFGEAASHNELHDLIAHARQSGQAAADLAETIAFWKNKTSVVQVTTPHPEVDVMLNGWLIYQTITSRLWGRSALYQPGGAFGFRDQLQDVMALVYSAPELVRAHILYAAAHQFTEGDVLHWWHPEHDTGVRTKISDDAVWLITATAHYVRITGDSTILSEHIDFKTGELLASDSNERYFEPANANNPQTLLEHCRRTIANRQFGSRGLPLIGTGDWNDGFNRVGEHGHGESVWLAWFLITAWEDYAELCEYEPLDLAAENPHQWRVMADTMRQTIDRTSWDGAWYIRAFYDDGTPLGSHNNDEAQIDSIAQSWSVIARGTNQERNQQAMRSVIEKLVTTDPPLVKLFAPPFSNDNSEEGSNDIHDPGYIKAYIPGMRENGGQYTHGSLWTALALSKLGWNDEAVKILNLMNPAMITQTPAGIARYRVEPYVTSADVYSTPLFSGRGGWTWYTGSASWMYRIWLEEILGFTVRGDQLTLTPKVPSDWNTASISYRFKNTTYDITFMRSEAGTSSITLDNNLLAHPIIPLVDDGVNHTVYYSIAN